MKSCVDVILEKPRIALNIKSEEFINKFNSCEKISEKNNETFFLLFEIH